MLEPFQLPFVQRGLIEVLILAVPAGLYLSYYAGTAGGASIALAIVAVYVLSIPAARIRVGRRKPPVSAVVTVT